MAPMFAWADPSSLLSPHNERSTTAPARQRRNRVFSTSARSEYQRSVPILDRASPIWVMTFSPANPILMKNTTTSDAPSRGEHPRNS